MTIKLFFQALTKFVLGVVVVGGLYLPAHSIARNDAETAAQVYSEWISRAEQIDVSVHASRK